jgi:hypothetical protein
MWKRAAAVAAALAGAGSLFLPAGDAAAQTITFGGVTIGTGARGDSVTLRRHPGASIYLRRLQRQKQEQQKQADARIRYGGASSTQKKPVEPRVNYGASSNDVKAKKSDSRCNFGCYTKSATTPVPNPSGTPQTGTNLQDTRTSGGNRSKVDLSKVDLSKFMIPSTPVPNRTGTPQGTTGSQSTSSAGPNTTGAPDNPIALSTPVPSASGNANVGMATRPDRPKPSGSIPGFSGDPQGGSFFSRTRGEPESRTIRDANHSSSGGGRNTIERTPEPEPRSARNESVQHRSQPHNDPPRQIPTVGGARSPLAPLQTAAVQPAGRPPLPARVPGSIWTHNSSVMQLHNENERFAFVYESPRSGLDNLGIRSGTLLIEGERTGTATFAGQATTFSPRQCGPAAFAVAGEANSDGSRVTLRGQKPNRDGNCQVTGYSGETLVFELRQ